MHDAGFIAMFLGRKKGGGIDEDGIEIFVDARRSPEHQQTGLRGNGEFHRQSDLESAAADEFLLGNELLDEALGPGTHSGWAREKVGPAPVALERPPLGKRLG